MLRLLEEDYDYDINDEWIKRENLPNLEHARDHLQGVLHAFYVTGDTRAIENSLEEICEVLEITMDITHQPAMERIK